ncbi:MAG: riboflavin synthase [Syntrophales bacterium]|nr:riboflavin synthase [Syntrophales bacterium]MDD5233418.1 riboflavin synthase [Syntrophales bacterium]MDD5532671.1 riboflavin synthase [Syntrophales bacterium]
MFTGIIESVGRVRKLTVRGDSARLEIETEMGLADVRTGDSISVDGACLTAVEVADKSFAADVSVETLSRTTLRGLKPGNRVNLEKALRADGFLGGHIVLGHVDGVGRIIKKEASSGSILVGIETDAQVSRFVVEKGSIAVDGISLTVNRVEKNRFFVQIIPHTAGATTLDMKKVSDPVNIETDIIGKYVARFMEGKGKIDRKFLAEYGFIK